MISASRNPCGIDVLRGPAKRRACLSDCLNCINEISVISPIPSPVPSRGRPRRRSAFIGSINPVNACCAPSHIKAYRCGALILRWGASRSLFPVFSCAWPMTKAPFAASCALKLPTDSFAIKCLARNGCWASLIIHRPSYTRQVCFAYTNPPHKENAGHYDCPAFPSLPDMKPS